MDGGTVRIPNAIFDAALAFGFSSRQWRVFWAIVRLTYGYRKTSDRISASQIAERCQMARQHAGKALLELEQLGVIWRRQMGTQGFEIGIVEDPEQWGGCHQIGGGTVTKSVTHAVTKTVTELSTTVTKTVRDCHRFSDGTVTKTVHTTDNRHISTVREAAANGSTSSSKGEHEQSVRAYLTVRFGEQIVSQAYDCLTRSGRQIADPRAYLLAACKGIASDAAQPSTRPPERESLVDRARRAEREALARLAREYDQAVATDDRAVWPPLGEPERPGMERGNVGGGFGGPTQH